MIELLCTMTMQAASYLAYERGIPISPEQMAADLRRVIKANLARLRAEWRDALKAHVSEGWLQTMIKIQAVELAKEALGL